MDPISVRCILCINYRNRYPNKIEKETSPRMFFLNKCFDLRHIAIERIWLERVRSKLVAPKITGKSNDTYGKMTIQEEQIVEIQKGETWE